MGDTFFIWIKAWKILSLPIFSQQPTGMHCVKNVIDKVFIIIMT